MLSPEQTPDICATKRACTLTPYRSAAKKAAARPAPTNGSSMPAPPVLDDEELEALGELEEPLEPEEPESLLPVEELLEVVAVRVPVWMVPLVLPDEPEPVPEGDVTPPAPPDGAATPPAPPATLDGATTPPAPPAALDGAVTPLAPPATLEAIVAKVEGEGTLTGPVAGTEAADGWVVTADGWVVTGRPTEVGMVVTGAGMPVTTPRVSVEGRKEVKGLSCEKRGQ